MKNIIPTSCIAVAGQNIRQWRKLYRNKIKMFGRAWTEHVYMFTPVWKPISSPEGMGKPYEIRVYKNDQGVVIWAVGQDAWCGTNGLWPHLNGNEYPFQIFGQTGPWIGEKRSWRRSYSDVRFLLLFERTRKDFFKKVTEHRVTYLLYLSREVEVAVQRAYENAESGRGRAGIGAYSGPASLTIEELKSLGVKVCHRPPTKKHPELAPVDHVVENFNWGAEVPEMAQWFRYGAGYRYNGSVGCNAGWVWYD